MNLEDSTTVKELIKILQTFPQDYPVLVSGYESGYEHFYYPAIYKVTHHPDNKYYEGEYQIAEEKDISLAFLPLFVVGYKYLHEIWMIKALLDVIFARLTRRKYEWTFIERTGIEGLRKVSPRHA